MRRERPGELTEIGRLFRAKLRALRDEERRTSATRPRRRARLPAVGSAPQGGELLRAVEVARLLNVTPKTIGRWAADEGLPCIRTVGGQRRYYWADVAAWLDQEP